MYLPKPAILNVKIHGHIIEQNNPPDKNANNAKFPVVNKPISIPNIPRTLNIFSVLTGLSLAKKKPAICTATQIAKNSISSDEKLFPPALLAINITAKAIYGTMINSAFFNPLLGLNTVIAPTQRPIIKPPQYIEIKGAILFINQQNQAQNLLKRLHILKENQANGEMKAPRMAMDNKDFGIGAQILHDLGIRKIRLVSNSKNIKKRVGMIGYGLEITEYVNY